MLRITIELHHISDALSQTIIEGIKLDAQLIGKLIKADGVKDNFAGYIKTEINPDHPNLSQVETINVKNYVK